MQGNDKKQRSEQKSHGEVYAQVGTRVGKIDIGPDEKKADRILKAEAWVVSRDWPRRALR